MGILDSTASLSKQMVLQISILMLPVSLLKPMLFELDTPKSRCSLKPLRFQDFHPQFAGFAVVVELQRQVLEVAEHVIAEVSDNTLLHLTGGEGLQVRHERLKEV